MQIRPTSVLVRRLSSSIALVALLAASGCFTTVDKNLEFQRVCSGDAVCHVEDTATGQKYYPPGHHECRCR
jgi:hypothetical protein